MEKNIVIVLDLGNYQSEYQEPVPFKAEVVEMNGNVITVKSWATKKEYEIYHHQVLEMLSIEEIMLLIDISKYGIQP